MALQQGITFLESQGYKVRESKLASTAAKRMTCLGKFEMPDSPKGTRPSLAYPLPRHDTIILSHASYRGEAVRAEATRA